MAINRKESSELLRRESEDEPAGSPNSVEMKRVNLRVSMDRMKDDDEIEVLYIDDIVFDLSGCKKIDST